MLPLAGKPMIEHILDRLREAGIEAVLIVTGYRAETIEQHLRDYPMELTFERQQTINGTGYCGPARPRVRRNDPFLLTFGDIICEPDDYRGISTLDGAAVLGVKHVDDPYQGAAVYEQGGVVTRIVEKPARALRQLTGIAPVSTRSSRYLRTPGEAGTVASRGIRTDRRARKPDRNRRKSVDLLH